MSGNKPIKKYRAGAISASVFKNDGTRKSGEAVEFNTIALQRSYKDKEGNWKNSTSLRVNDLPKAVLVLNKVYEELTLKNIDTGAAVENVEEEVVM